MISPSYVDGLELRIEELRERNAKLESEVEQLQEKIFELQCFDVDVIRCLKTMAFEHNHVDIPIYQELAKKCMDRISVGNKATEIKSQAVEDEYKDLLYVVANQYDGNGGSEWAIGANHVFVLFAKEVNKRVNQLRQADKVE